MAQGLAMTGPDAPETRPETNAEGGSPTDGLAARRAAMALVGGALSQRGGLDDALDGSNFAGLDTRDRGLARMLAMTVLRRLGPIDARLATRLKKPPPQAVTELLRLGAAQLAYLDIPAFAAVDTSVRLAAEQASTRPFKGLVNAVLRELGRAPAEPDAPETLVPDWLFARWTQAFGVEAARAVASQLAEEPATDLTPRRLEDAKTLAADLEASPLAGGSLRSQRRGEVSQWPGYDEGLWWVQDAAAAIPARLLALRPGETALDLCAAPGGKTLQMAAAGARVTALDRSAPRLRRLTQSLARTGLEAEVVAAPAETWDDPRQFDAVLLDAPCSATGTFRRQPEVLWNARPGDIVKLAQVQARLLDHAAGRVAPGGRLIYCVCALEPEEGEQQAAAFAARHPEFAPLPLEPGEAGAPEGSITPEGWLRTLPHLIPGGLDGFFAARWRRAR